MFVPSRNNTEPVSPTSKFHVVAIVVISPPFTAKSPPVVTSPLEPVTSKFVKSIFPVVPKIVFVPTEIAFVRSVSVTSIAVVSAASGVIESAPVASRPKFTAVTIKSSPAASPPATSIKNDELAVPCVSDPSP